MKMVKVAAAAAAGMTCDFSSSTIGKDWIWTIGGLSYFAKGSAWALGSESVSESCIDKAVIFEDLFTAGLRMPPHPVLTDILQKFQVQLHQLTPNATMQLSKFI
jgi:hypothetical protein